jgi:hypothetical protein
MTLDLLLLTLEHQNPKRKPHSTYFLFFMVSEIGNLSYFLFSIFYFFVVYVIAFHLRYLHRLTQISWR